MSLKLADRFFTIGATRESPRTLCFESKCSLIVNPCECPEEERSREVVFILFENTVVISLIWELSYGSLQIFFGKKTNIPLVSAVLPPKLYNASLNHESETLVCDKFGR